MYRLLPTMKFGNLLPFNHVAIIMRNIYKFSVSMTTCILRIFPTCGRARDSRLLWHAVACCAVRVFID